MNAALASPSEQFGLGRPPGLPAATAGPSGSARRPWGLRGLVRAVPTRVVVGPGYRYDPVRQVLVDGTGRPLIDGDDEDGPSADSVSDNDGDEGRSEDWKNDFAPDHPFVP
jgi:putative ATP-grasp target RiPP